MNDIISKFTNHLKTALTRALCLVIENNGESIEPAHLLWALGTQKGSVASEVLEKAGVKDLALTELSGTTTNIPDSPTPPQSLIPILSERSKQIIEKAVLTANIYEHRYIGTEHLLSGLIQSSNTDVDQFFSKLNINPQTIVTNLTTVFKTTQSFKNASDQLSLSSVNPLFTEELEDALDESINPNKAFALDYFTEELTHKDVIGHIDPVIGRDKEIDRLTKILARRTKNNPILIGEPGVGKTAIVEGIAKQIAEGTCPHTLLGKKIHRLDLASLVAGTMYRGEFESRLRQLIDEVTERDDVILFIDEVHTITGAGASSGSLDAANILKPALARGEIRCIGSTTPIEYKKFIETDGALERRFEPIRIGEPNIADTRKILKGLQSFYEDFHQVSYSDEAIETALQMAERYLTNKQFPDKAIDLLDEAGASVNVKRKTPKGAHDLVELKNRLEEIKLEKQTAVLAENFTDAVDLKEEEDSLLERIEDHAELKNKRPSITVSSADIVKVIADMTGVPVEKLGKKEFKQLARLEKTLKSEIFGQDKTIEKVAHAVRRARLGIHPENKPLSSFMFVGPSGVGKTELASQLAKILFHDKNAFLRLDMSEFSDKFTGSKLIGAPAGYVGYRESSKLTDHVKAYPHSVILFDELEKAHSSIHNLLLQILDNGMLTDSTGRTINFRNCIIIATSNIGGDRFEKVSLGFSEAGQDQKLLEKHLRDQLEEKFSREFINRINHVCVFNALDDKALQRVARKELKDLQKRLEKNLITLIWKNPLIGYILKNTTSKFGARDVKRVINENIEHEITKKILEGTEIGNLTFEISVGKKKPIITRKKTKSRK